MATESTRPVAWTKPEFKRLGTMRDVKAAQTAGPQGAGAKS